MRSPTNFAKEVDMTLLSLRALLAGASLLVLAACAESQSASAAPEPGSAAIALDLGGSSRVRYIAGSPDRRARVKAMVPRRTHPLDPPQCQARIIALARHPNPRQGRPRAAGRRRAVGTRRGAAPSLRDHATVRTLHRYHVLRPIRRHGQLCLRRRRANSTSPLHCWPPHLVLEKPPDA